MQPERRNPAESSRIESWKEIAAFFGRDERTVKRWEKTRKLPVHRLPGEKGGVFAYKRELTTWLNSAAIEKSLSQDADLESVASLPDSLLPDADLPNPGNAELESPEAATGALNVAADSPIPPPVAETPAPAPNIGDSRRSLKTILLAAVSIAAVLVLIYPASRQFLRRSHVTKNVVVPLQASSATTPAAATNSDQAGKSSSDPAAQELYLKGRYYWNHRTDASLKLAVEAFTQAVVRDPQYAPAYAGLADTYNLMTQYSYMPQAQAFPLALAAARKAVALDDSLSEAHRALAFGLFYWEWDAAGAFREYQRAIDLDPKDVEAHNWYATSLLVANQLPRAAEQIEKARELDPTSRIVIANQALILADGEHRPASIARLTELEGAEPDFLAPPQYLAEIYLADRNYPAYLAQLERVAATSRDPEKMALAAAAKHGWEHGGGRGLLESLRTNYQAGYDSGRSSGYDLAHICAILGDKPAADRYLQAAVDARDFQAMNVLFGDFNQAMKGDARFEEIKRQIALRMNRSNPSNAESQRSTRP